MEAHFDLLYGCCCYCCYFRTSKSNKIHCSSSILFFIHIDFYPIEFWILFLLLNNLMAYNGVPPKCAEKEKKKNTQTKVRKRKKEKKRTTSRNSSRIFTICRFGRSMWFIVFCSSIFNLKFVFLKCTHTHTLFVFIPYYMYANYKALKFHTK